MAASPRQTSFKLRTWGGARRGAGRKPVGDKAGVPHVRRAPLASRFPVHATLRAQPGLASLRSARSFAALEGAFAAGRERSGFRLIHFSVQGNHCHLVVEATDARSLARGMQGLTIRMARAVNRVQGRRGRVFADRYFAHILRTPAEVARAVSYVLHNRARHQARAGGRVDDALDARSSITETALRWLGEAPRTAEPRTWLLRVGWRRARGPDRPAAG